MLSIDVPIIVFQIENLTETNNNNFKKTEKRKGSGQTPYKH